MHVISVAPTEGGWMVEADMLAAPLLFQSGGKAEDAAKRLGEALAKTGQWGEVRVHLKGGELLGRFICPPRPAPVEQSGLRIAIAAGEPWRRTGPAPAAVEAAAV